MKMKMRWEKESMRRGRGRERRSILTCATKLLIGIWVLLKVVGGEEVPYGEGSLW